MKRDIGIKDPETMRIEYCKKELLLKSNVRNHQTQIKLAINNYTSKFRCIALVMPHLFYMSNSQIYFLSSIFDIIMTGIRDSAAIGNNKKNRGV